ncbi:hypothetical protein NDU88_000667 [Pleurodeles waltl]|uniref:Uncharacterized protein n=1 Tax=Pleurodeles waltl TaxID=8319 RepID=A0AAV7P6E2_PLEWA|nr:hypothetical protein NDU88_000667 [Pleurodeles waltl]
MAPKRARSASDATMSQAEFHSLSNLWRMAKTHGMDWALQELSEGPEKNPQLGPVPPLPKWQRRPQRITWIPPRSRELHPPCNQRPQQLLRVSPRGSPRHLDLKASPQEDRWATPARGLRARVISTCLGPRTVLPLGPVWLRWQSNPNGGPIPPQSTQAIQSTAVGSFGPTPVQVIRQVGMAQTPIKANSMGRQVSVAMHVWMPPLAITIPVQSPLSTSPLFRGSTVSTLAPPVAIAWHVPADTKEKIYKGEFVELFDLINTGVVPGKARSRKEGNSGHGRFGWNVP